MAAASSPIPINALARSLIAPMRARSSRLISSWANSSYSASWRARPLHSSRASSRRSTAIPGSSGMCCLASRTSSSNRRMSVSTTWPESMYAWPRVSRTFGSWSRSVSSSSRRCEMWTLRVESSRPVCRRGQSASIICSRPSGSSMCRESKVSRARRLGPLSSILCPSLLIVSGPSSPIQTLDRDWYVAEFVADTL